MKRLYNLESTKGIKLGLENILNLLDLMQNPQENFKTIHVAGTNGKGSCSAMIASILSEEGFNVGLYTSPHLTDFRERILVNGKKISENDVARILNKINPFILGQTFFEVVTAAAFQYFSEQKVDFAVLEVGMGGRLDATNVTEPLVSVITNIALEHEEYLGGSVLEIAREKAGIIKENNVLVTGERDHEILNLIKEICKKKNTCLIRAGEHGDVKYRRLDYTLYSQSFHYISENEKIKFEIPLIGKHQLNNASCAIAAVKALKRYNIKISNDNIYDGLRKTQWKGRCEVIQENPLIILDAAHNPAGISGLKDTLSEIKEIADYKNLILIVGILKTKKFKKILEIIVPAADAVILTKPDTPHAMATKFMNEYLTELNIENILIEEKVSDAVKFALSNAGKEDVICVTGSLFTVGEALRYVNKNKTKDVQKMD